jgi:hypothetical protein
MRPCRTAISYTALFLLLAGCDSRRTTAVSSVPAGADVAVETSVPEKARTDDLSILFIGNSHTSFHDLPNLVCKMITFRRPGREVHSRVLGVNHLDDTARRPQYRQEIESQPWKYVVLQGQKISASGRFDYSRKEGIDIAKLARSRGAEVLFFSEWGLQNVEGDGARTEKIYQEMARAAGVGLVPVGRAWDLALAGRPDLPLYAPDGNHQSAVGAFLTACVLAGRLTGESPAPLAAFSYPDVNEKDRKFLADSAAKALM